MNKTEYRRAFIMLRPAVPGWTGHVRLERRTMTGSLYFIVSARDREAALHAALVGRRGDEYYAAALGALRQDSRGQFTLATGFDPRRIEGRPLESYPLIAVARSDGGRCRVVLSGNVDGAYPMDADAVQAAVCASLSGGVPADDLPAPEEAPPAVEMAEMQPVAPADAAAPESPDAGPADTMEVPPAAEDAQAGGSPKPVAPEAAEEEAAKAVSQQPDDTSTDRSDASIAGGPSPGDAGAASATAPVEPRASTTRIYTRMRAMRSAGEGRSSGDDVPDDPGEEALPRWRLSAVRSATVSCAMPLEDGYAYVRAPLPDACGTGYCLVGFRTDGGRVVSVRMAVPGCYAPQPPAGLSGSVWVGAGGDDGAGYWVYTVQCDADGPSR